MIRESVRKKYALLLLGVVIVLAFGANRAFAGKGEHHPMESPQELQAWLNWYNNHRGS